ncbi:MAG TPA: hypothetical protein DIC52_02460 [Candidatus Latescibacteria bacterium]|nr:hypothetical protein [Candidatus Latescibacterota bacterium]
MPGFEKLFRAPYGVPNALERVDDGLWIADQISDRLALVDITKPGGDNPGHASYGVTFRRKEIPSDGSNISGLAYGQETFWVASNGPGTLWRPSRPTDAGAGAGVILQVHADSGQTLMRRPVPGGGGVHGIEYDRIDPGHLWITTLSQKTLTKVRISDWQVLHAIALPYVRAHGVVRTAAGVWVVHTADRVIVHLDVEDGHELDRIEVPTSEPEPHGLCDWGGGELAYCDATSGWVVRIHGI